MTVNSIIVDTAGVEPDLPACKADAFPIMLPAHFVEWTGIEPATQCLQGTVAPEEHATPKYATPTGLEPASPAARRYPAVRR